jgi:uncharacterized protein YrrD
MEIAIGAPVYAVGGKRLGEVDGVIVDAGTKRARAIFVDTGLFDRGKHMLEVSAIERGDAEGIHLETTSAQTAAESETEVSGEVAFAQRVPPPTTFVPAAGVGGPVIADEPAQSGLYPDDSSFFDLAPIDPPPTEVKSNLLDSEVVLGRGTHAISADGDRLGEVDSFTLGDMGLIETIGVSEGLIFKEHATFSLPEIDEFGTDEVHLRLNRAEAEGR